MGTRWMLVPLTEARIGAEGADWERREAGGRGR